MDYSSGKRIVIEQLAADYGADVSRLSGGDVIRDAKYGARSKTYLSGAPFLDMTFIDGMTVVAADGRIADYAKRYVDAAGESFRAFDAPNIMLLNAELAKYGQTVGHMLQGFLPRECARPVVPDGMRAFYGEEINELFAFGGFHNALCYSTTARRRDEIAVACFDGSEPVAIAGCSNDGERMWQIGVDVKPTHRNRGLATALVRTLKDIIGERGMCPYYCCAWSNVASQRTAASAGFVPAWAELSAVPLDDKFVVQTKSKILSEI